MSTLSGRRTSKVGATRFAKKQNETFFTIQQNGKFLLKAHTLDTLYTFKFKKEERAYRECIS